MCDGLAHLKGLDSLCVGLRVRRKVCEDGKSEKMERIQTSDEVEQMVRNIQDVGEAMNEVRKSFT